MNVSGGSIYVRYHFRDWKCCGEQDFNLSSQLTVHGEGCSSEWNSLHQLQRTSPVILGLRFMKNFQELIMIYKSQQGFNLKRNKKICPLKSIRILFYQTGMSIMYLKSNKMPSGRIVSLGIHTVLLCASSQYFSNLGAVHPPASSVSFDNPLLMR